MPKSRCSNVTAFLCFGES